MKTTKRALKVLTLPAAFALTFCLALLFTVSADAQPKGGASKLMKPITSYSDVANLKEGDMVAMACPKCKTITVTYIQTQKGHIKTATPGEEHLCPGCEQKFVVVGEGKAKHQTVTHVCKKCGSQDAFCCVLKQGEGATEGMTSK